MDTTMISIQELLVPILSSLNNVDNTADRILEDFMCKIELRPLCSTERRLIQGVLSVLLNCCVIFHLNI